MRTTTTFRARRVTLPLPLTPALLCLATSIQESETVNRAERVQKTDTAKNGAFESWMLAETSAAPSSSSICHTTVNIAARPMSSGAAATLGATP